MNLFGAKTNNNNAGNDLLPEPTPISTPLRNDVSDGDNEHSFSSRLRNALLVSLSVVFVVFVTGLFVLLGGWTNLKYSANTDLTNKNTPSKNFRGNDESASPVVNPSPIKTVVVYAEDDDPSKDLSVPGKAPGEVVGEETYNRTLDYVNFVKFLEDHPAYPVSTKESLFNSKDAIARFLGYVLRDEKVHSFQAELNCYNAFYEKTKKENKEFKNVEEAEEAFKKFRKEYF